MTELIKARKKGLMPDGVFADTSTVKLCQIERGELPSKHKNDKHIKKDTLAKIIAALPGDADFDRLSEQQDYVFDGFYLSFLGELKAIPGNTPRVVKKSTIKKAGSIKRDTGATAGKHEEIVVDFPID